MSNNSVLFILHLPPPVHGAAMMGKYIHDSKLVNDSFDCHYINLATAKDLSDIGKVGIKKIFVFFKLLKFITKEIKRIKPSLVYVTPNAKGGAFIKDFIVVEMLKFLHCRVVLHYHNKGVSQYQEKLLFDFLYRHFFKNVKVILLAKALYGDIKKYVSKENVYFCPNGIPCNESKDFVTNKGGTPQLLFLSNLLIEKGLLVLLEACSILKKKGLTFQCSFIGGETTDFTAESFNEEIKQRNLSDVVKYLGKKYGLEKDKFIGQSDIFVFPTFYNNECFPLVLLEAMQQGKVCISTTEGGIKDIIEDGITGFIVEKKDSSALADKIEILIKDNSLCQHMGKAGFMKYQKEFTLEKFEQNIVSILLNELKTL